MEATSWLLRLAAVLAMATTLMGPSHAYNFYVGGRDGWVQNPSESYSSWSGRNRFQVNDTLVFRYNKGVDSVLVVDAAAFRACNTTNPMRRLDGGDSVFRLDRSGPFFFVSGVPGRCQSGQKLLVVVLAIRGGGKPPSTPPPLPSPSGAPSPGPFAAPSPSPTGAPSPSTSQHSPAPSPSTSPAGTPTPAATAGGPGSSAPAGEPSSEVPLAPEQGPPGASSGRVAAAPAWGGAAFLLLLLLLP